MLIVTRIKFLRGALSLTIVVLAEFSSGKKNIHAYGLTKWQTW